MLLKLDAEGVADKLAYQPGDHVAVFPANQPELVDAFLSKLHNVPDMKKVYQLQIQQEIVVGMTSWIDHGKMPPMTLKTAFSRYVDLNTPPTQSFLKQMTSLTSDENEQQRISDLATV